MILIKEQNLFPCSERKQLVWRRKIRICLNLMRDFKGERSCRRWREVPGRGIRHVGRLSPCWVVPAVGCRMKGERLLQSDLPTSETKCGFSFISSRVPFINMCNPVA